MWQLMDKAITALQGWLNYNRENRRIRQERLLEALILIQRTANLTRACLAEDAADEAEGAAGRGGRRPGGSLGPEIRERVSQGWVDVGAALARCQDGYRDEHIEEIFRELAERCFQKGVYWANPNGWEKSGADIQLSRLVQDAATMIDEIRTKVRHGMP